MSTPIDLTRDSGLPSEGMHLFKITDAKEQNSKSSGQPQWILGLTCQDSGEDQGKKMSVFLSLAPQARFKIDQLLDAIEAPKHGSMTVEQMVGKLLKVVVVHGEYEGNVNANAYKMLPAGSTAQVDLPTRSSSSSSRPSELSGTGRKTIF